MKMEGLNQNSEIFMMALLKFGDEVYMRDLIENGTIYMKPIEDFRRIEDEELRGDPYEGVSEINNYPAGEFTLKDSVTGEAFHTGNYQAMHLRKSYEKVLGNLYCLYAVSSVGFPDPDLFAVDPKVEGFGTHCVMIKQWPEFLKRFDEACDSLGLKYDRRFVEYYDKKQVSGPIHLFQKSVEYEYQKEYRFYVERDEISPFIVRLGDLSDIAQLYSTKDIIETLRLRKNEKPA